VSVNASSLLTLNPIIVNLELGLYGLLFVCIFIYVHAKFRKADRLLKGLKKEWDGAESKHSGLIQVAQHRISRLGAGSEAVKPGSAAPSVSQAVSQAVPSDTRNQVTAMGRRGIPVSDIARSCGLPEGEVDVLLSMARMQRTEA
jgi:DNA-directed RNA polymerase specialized sigma24 family protein